MFKDAEQVFEVMYRWEQEAEVYRHNRNIEAQSVNKIGIYAIYLLILISFTCLFTEEPAAL